MMFHMGLAQALSERSMAETFTINRKGTPSKDGMGGSTGGYGPAGTVRGTVETLSGQEVEMATQLNLVNAVVLSVPAGTVLKSTDQLTTGTRTFEVVGGSGVTYEASRRVLCKEITK